MKICFMGTPSFASFTLQKLLDNKYNVACVYTKEPKPRDRGQKVHKTAVHILADKYQIPIVTPQSLKDIEAKENFLKQNFDLVIVASYGLILPKEILQSPKYGCINIHASLLPRWRGASPIQMAIKCGDKKTGVTTMLMNEGLDTGDILQKQEIDISDETTFTSLYEELTTLGGNLIIKTLKALQSNALKVEHQDESLVTYAKIMKREDGLINFKEQSALDIDRTVRAFNPFPSTYIKLADESILKIRQTKVVINIEVGNTRFGEIVSTNPLIMKCKNGYLEILQLQKQGGKIMGGNDFVNGYKLKKGDFL